MSLAQEIIYQRSDIYGQLDSSQREIRVMLLRPGPFSSPLECSLTQTSLADPALDVEKLSYTWGDPELVSHILVNGHRLRIHASLDIALRYLRREDAPRLLWTDAVCINQANTAERSSQVAMMAQVYESPSAVVVWLGPASDDSRMAFELVAEMQRNQFADEYAISHIRDPTNFPQWRALFALCRREYWNRVWTAQEIVCGSQAILVCGRDTMPFIHLAELAWVVQGRHYGDSVRVPGILEAGLDRLRLPSNYWVLQLAHGKEGEADLLTLLTAFRAHVCSDPRDKVYGMASMAKDVRGSSFRIDYELLAGQVYLQTARWIIESSKKLNVLSCRLGQDPAFGLPSWVPDWTSKRYQNQLSVEVGYMATGYSRTDATFSPDSRILKAAGCIFGIIDNIGEPFMQQHRMEVLWTDHKRKAIQEWLRIALQENSSTAKVLSPDQRDGRINAFWRTLICNRAEAPYQINDEWYRSMFDVARGAIAVPEVDTPSSTLSEEDRLQMYVAPLVTSLDNRMAGRRFFSSGDASGIMGLGPSSAQLGDRVCLLMGCNTPVLLRPENSHFVLVGEAYVHGVMQGELDGEIQSRRLLLHTLSIH